MTSERVQRRIERQLDQADEAADAVDWARVNAIAQSVLAVDAENADALAFMAMAGPHLASISSVELNPTAEATVPPLPVGEGPIYIKGEGEDSSSDTDPSRASGHSADQTPTSFANDRYQVSKFLGEGGKKRVYQAHDTLLDREVAFAVIKTEGFDQTSKERISREAQAMGRLGVHPNIVAVLDLGQEDDGSPYMVTELMGGGDVEALLEGASKSPLTAGEGEGEGSLTNTGPSRASGHGSIGSSNTGLPLDRTIEIGKAVCEGLEFAHARGIVHRDLKPGNVWLTEDGIAKIGDFGLAVMTDRSRLTREGMMVGTVSYMPPEQATGGDITPKADLYSLGAMLYEMVTGRPPFLGDDEVAIISQHINTPPVAPTWHNGAVPRPLEALVMRLLSKDPSERPDSAQDVLNALDAIDLTARGETVEREANSLESLAGGVFVGRQAEMDQLKSALEDVLGGSGRLVTLVGEPGIGKTRISEELATYAGLRGAQVLWGRCYETGGQPPYWPWVQAIRTYVRDADPDELRRQMGSSASVIAEVVTDVKDRLPDLQAAPQMDDPESTRFRLFDSITSFLKTASNTKPLVLVLDDLHWSDRPSLTLLEFVAREIGQSRLMIVATYRDMELNRRHPLSVTLGDLSRERLFERVLLRGLTEADIARFIEIASGIQAPTELSATIRRHTEGNPLFVTEVVRELVQSGELAKNVNSGSSTWSVRIPEGVREVIGRRLDRLSERANEMLTTAAVVGRDFRLDTLKGLSEDTTEGQLLDVLDESLDAKIIEELSDALGHYQFTHALMQETLTSELSLTRRVRLHARIAEALETLYGDRAEENASELAYHFVEAEAVIGTEKMLRYSVVAGEQAMEANGPEEALVHFERAEAALAGAEDSPLTGRVWFGLGAAGAAVHGGAQSQSYWDITVKAFDWFLEHEDTKSAVAVARYPISILAIARGTVDLFERALLLVPPDSLDAGWIGTRLGNALAWDRGDVDSAIQAGERALSIGIATEQGTLEARALYGIGLAYLMSGDATTALVQVRAGLEKARQHGDLQSIVRLGAQGTQAALAVGDLGFARKLSQELAGAADSLRDKTWFTLSLVNRLCIAVATGSRKDVAGLSDELRNTSNQSLNLKWQMALAEHEFGGDFDAEALLKSTEGVVRLIPSMASVAFVTRSGEIFKVVESVASTVIGEIDGPFPNWRTVARVCLGLAAANRAEAALAEEQYGVLKVEWETGSQPYMWMMNISSHRVLGLLAATFGDTEAAAGHFEDALAFAEEAGYVHETVWTQTEYAEMLLDRAEGASPSGEGSARDSDREKAIELQDAALVVTQELGMRPLTERILARRDILRA